MNPLPAELVRKWLPDWQRFAELAAAAALDPAEEPGELAALALRAEQWPSPFGHKRDQYVGAVLIWAAKAYCRQDSIAMRTTLEGVLREAALAFQGRLARVSEAAGPAPVLPLRRPRRDIDDMPEDAGED